MFNIYIDDLVGNAFIPCLERTGERTLSLSKIESYGGKVVNSLKKEGLEGRLVLSRDYTKEFFFNYSDWFTLNDDKITVSSEISADDLVKRFSGVIALAVLKELRKEENIKVLF